MIIALTAANSFTFLLTFYMFFRILNIRRKEKQTYWTLLVLICYALWSIAYFFVFTPTGARPVIEFFMLIKFGFSYLSIPISFIIICLYSRIISKELEHLYYIFFISFVIYGLFSFKYFPVSSSLTEYWYGWGLAFPLSSYYLHTTVILYMILISGALILFVNYKKRSIKKEKKEAAFLLIAYILHLALVALLENILPALTSGRFPAAGNITAPVWAFAVYRIIAERAVLTNSSNIASKINLPLVIIDKDLNIISTNDAADDNFKYCMKSSPPSFKDIIADKYLSFSKFIAFLEDPLTNSIDATLFTACGNTKVRHRFIITKADNFDPSRAENSFLLILSNINRYTDQMKSLKAKNREKELLLQEIHHRVKNNLQVIIGLINFNINNQDSRDDSLYIDLINRIRTIQQAHETIYSIGDLDRVPMKSYLSSVIDKIRQIYSSAKQIDITADIGEFHLTQKRAINIGILVNEIICNAYKYAFRDMDEGQITLSLKRQGEHFSLLIKDNGCGTLTSEEPESRYSTGMNIINGIVYQLNGDLMKKNSNGTEYMITIPVEDDGLFSEKGDRL